jgi:hypothetical protein
MHAERRLWLRARVNLPLLVLGPNIGRRSTVPLVLSAWGSLGFSMGR